MSKFTTSRLLLLLPVLLICLLGAGCDNPACIFGPGGCTGGGAGLGENPASLPVDGEWIEAPAPTILATFPSSSGPAEVDSPVVLVFNESITPENFGTTPPTGLGTAFQLQSTTGGTVPLSVAALIGDGRVLVLFPQAALQAATIYDIVLTPTAVLADRTGKSFANPANGRVGGFTTTGTPASAPGVLMTWPQDGSTNQSGTTEIAVVFDRALDPTSVDASSFDVTVDGNPPPFDPSPEVLAVGQTTDARVFRWRSLDAQGLPAPLGESANVAVALSGTGHEILDVDGAALPPTNFAFDTQPFSAPLSAAITSAPADAIGINQISGPADLAVAVQLSGAQSGDLLVLTLFGTERSISPNPRLIALRREVALTAPFDSFTMTAAEVNLLSPASPVQGLFVDGTVTFAFQLRRGDVESPVRLLDVDTTKNGIQSPILDTVAPTLLGLSTSGNSVTTLRSNLRDVVLVGRASETLSRAGVVTALGDNSITPGVVPSVVGSDSSGLFIAAPVRVGLLSQTDNPLDFVLTLYDRALNTGTIMSSVADPFDGFRQLGVSGPGGPLPSGLVSVEVFDAATLLPVANANVYTHQNLAGTVLPVSGGTATTDPAGVTIVQGATSGETILTVEKSGYDLFTADGVPTRRLGVPLSPTGLGLGSVTGTFGPADPSISTGLNGCTRAVADSRHPEIGETLFPVNPCTTQAPLSCPFGPFSIRPNRMGAESAVTVLVPADLFSYAALTFLKTAELVLPLAPVAAGSSQQTELPIPILLNDGTLDAEERPVDVPQHMLSTAAWPLLSGDPQVSVEATAPGLEGTLTVGRGVAFDASPPPDTWVVRAAYPGSADGIQDVPTDKLGRLVSQGTIDADLLLRVEVVDPDGNRGGARPRFSLSSLSLSPPPAPILPANPATPNPGGVSFDLTFQDVLPDAASPPGRGIYRVVLKDSAGRSWTIYRPDPPDAAGPNVVLHVPDLAGVFPLASGPLDCQISAWSWPTLDLRGFLWTDIEREHDVFVHSQAQSFTPP